METTTTNILTNIQKSVTKNKLEKTEENLNILSNKLKKENKPIFIELIGTPKSGKTTLKNALIECFTKFDIDVMARKETAEYNPIDKKSKQYDIWMVLELFRNLSEDLSKKNGQVIIYDRGILDRLPWMKYDIESGIMSKKDFDRFTKLYELDCFKGYSPITQIFETSPSLSVQRKGKPGFFVNEKTITKFNNYLHESMPQIQKNSPYSNYIITDKYQGNLKEFILDNTNLIINGINKELDDRNHKRDEIEK